MKKFVAFVLAILMALSLFSAIAEDEPHTITMMIDGGQTVTENNMVIEAIRANTGINMEVIFTNLDYDQKLNMLIAANTLPDVFSTHDQIALDLRDQGKIMDFAPYLDEYGPNILASYEEGELANLLINTEDAVYGLNDRSSGSINTLLIRKDWLEAVNLKVPTTVEELYEVMKAFTFEDPDGNGADDTYGFVASINVPNTWEHVFSAFGIPYGQNIVLDDGTVTTFMKHESFLKVIEFLRTLYSEGIMDPDFATMPQLESFERFWTGKVGMFNWNSVGAANNWYPGRYVFDVPENPGDIFACVRIINEDTGLASGGKKVYYSQTSYCAVIATSCKHPEDAVKLIDYIYYTEEGCNLTYFGVEDVMYRWIDKENGVYERIGEYADDVNHRAAGGFVYNQRGGWTAENASTRTRNSFAQSSQIEELAYALDYAYIPVILDARTEYGSQLDAIVTECVSNLIVTTGDVEAEYAQYVARWDNEGGEKLEVEMTEWWAANR